MVPLPKCVVDSHVHFWHPDQVRIPWLETAPQLNERRDADRYSQETDASSTQVRAAVYVETDVDPSHGLVEADWIRHYSEKYQANGVFGGIQGIVAYAPVHQGAIVRRYLQLLRQIAGPRLRGVRHLIQDPGLDPERVRQPTFVAGVRCLAAFGLSFDLNINCHAAPAQFPPLLDLVAQCPEVSFVLDHMAKPPCDSKPGEPAFEFWKANMIALGKHENVVGCKVSGLVTETTVWTPEQLRPFVQVAREAFGIDRLMFGGDWPVCESAVRWKTWLSLLSEIVQDWSEEDKEKLFVSNATRIYRLDS